MQDQPHFHFQRKKQAFYAGNPTKSSVAGEQSFEEGSQEAGERVLRIN